MTSPTLPSLVDLMKALAHPVRLRMLALLREGELCVCQMVDILDLATSTASEHLAELRKAGLLVERREGRWVYYALSPRPEWMGLLEALWPHVDAVPQIAQDRLASAHIRGLPVEVTCERTRRCAPNRPQEAPNAH